MIRRKGKYFDLDNPNLTCNHSTYRRHAGYCAPEMFCDSKGLKLHEEEGMLWLRNELISHSNDSHRDVIATIPNSQVLATYQLLQDFLNSKGILDQENKLNQETHEASGWIEEYETHGLRL